MKNRVFYTVLANSTNLERQFLQCSNRSYEKLGFLSRLIRIKKATRSLRMTSLMASTPTGFRTPVLALRGLCPRPLDDGGLVVKRENSTMCARARQQNWCYNFRHVPLKVVENLNSNPSAGVFRDPSLSNPLGEPTFILADRYRPNLYQGGRQSCWRDTYAHQRGNHTHGGDHTIVNANPHRHHTNAP